MAKGGNPRHLELIRRINRSLILNMVKERQPVSRAQLARALNLSKTTVSSIVDELVRKKLLVEYGDCCPSGGAGRPSVMLGFVDDAAAPLAGLVDFEIAYPGCEQLKFFMATDRFFWNNGDFPEYVEYHREMEQYLPRALAEAEKKADEFGKEFAQRHHADPIHYFVGAGSQYGAAYSYAMCYWEEQHWLRAKAVHAGEFFHGTLEIIDRDTPVTVFLGEDAERPLAERVANFLPRICGNFTLIDSRDYELAGIRPEYRGSLSHLVTHAVTQRIDAHIELLNRHPMEIRRYYRCLDY